MSILETFIILFQSDSSDVDEGARNADESTKKLDQSLRETDRSAQNAGKSFADLANQAVKTLLPFVGLIAIKGAVSNFVNTADAAGKLAANLRIDVEQLQAWQGAAARVGGDAEGMASSMKSLNDKMEEIRRTGGGDAAFAFNRLGVSIRDSEGRVKSADRMLMDLAGRFEGLSRQKAMMLGEKLGLDAGTITLLQQGKKGVEELLLRQKELGLYTKKDTETARKYNNAMADMGQSFQSVSAVVMRVLLPVFIGIAEGMTKASITIRKHESLVTGFFIALSTIMGVLAIKAALAFAPFLIFAAIILVLATAFAILYDDVQNFMAGNDSMIGRLSKDYPHLGELVKDLVAAFGFLWDIAKAIGTLLVESAEDPVSAWQNFINTVGPLFDQFKERWPALGQAIEDVGVILKWLFDMAWPILQDLAKLVAKVIGTLVDGLAEVAGWIGKALSWAAGEIKGEIKLQKPEDVPDKPTPPPERIDAANDNPVQKPEKPETLTPSPLPERPAQSAQQAPAPLPPAPRPYAVGSPPPRAENPARIGDGPRPTPGAMRPAAATPLTTPRPDRAASATLPPLPGIVPPNLAVNIARGQDAIRQTNNTPFSAQPPGAAFRAQPANRQTTVEIAKIEVATQATDAAGIGRDISSALEREMRSAVDNYDDGVRA